MTNMMLLVVLLLILNVVLSYNINIRSNTIVRKRISINAVPDTEDDSSELDFESSASIKEKKEKLKLAQVEQEKNVVALQKASREFVTKLEKLNENSKQAPASVVNSIKEAAPISVAVVPSLSPSSSSSSSSPLEGISSAENKAFDAGLLIAFPVIVATLGLFFFFPFIRENLASSLPPLPSVEEMMQNQ